MNKTVQNGLQQFLEQAVRDGRERGVQAAVYLHGELVASAWAGTAGAKTGRPVTESTLFPVFSSTKGIAGTIVHRLAERGLLRYDQTIASLWPEFACNGKEHITLRQALTHTSGLPSMPPVGIEGLTDWDTACRAIAQLTPEWEPGSRMEYHAITYSWLAGEPAVRAAGKSFPQLLREEIAAPLGVEDEMFVGLPASEDSRVAVLEEPALENCDLAPYASPSIPLWILPLHRWMNTPEGRRSCVPASSGIMSARALARHYAALLPDGAEGVTLLPPERVREALCPLEIPGGSSSPRVLGYALGVPHSAVRPDVFGAGGYGGSFGFADLRHGLAVAFTKNLYSPAGIESELPQLLGGLLGIEL